MSDPQSLITQEEIHAYVDGSLCEERRVEVERALGQRPELALQVNDYFALNSLFHERYDRVLLDPVPAHLKPNLAQRWRDAVNWLQYAGMAAALVLGAGVGVAPQTGDRIAIQSGGNQETPTISQQGPEAFAQQAAIAHVSYVRAVDRPSEMGTGHDQDFAQWLSDKLGTDVHPPVLMKSGFDLMGGRVLHGPNGRMAMFMYRDAQGERVTLCVSRRKVSSNTTTFKLYQDGSVNVFYWVDGDFGYAISGGVDRKVLLELSHEVYAQLTGATPG